ncbi:MAG: phage integrase N-terminal SAM-like domain-containing protein, partial [Verrucomicrobiota bacterium JB023]|nr:phage integrase N-terminal SAM-like domain-containing protein [Verrucomicrobiota bacterium JB023]
MSRFVHTRGLAPRTVKSYLCWVRQLDQHFPATHTPGLSSRQVLDFFVHLQTGRTLAGSTVNQAVCANRKALGTC